MEIKKTNEIKANKINALIYGESGVGKTTLASTIKGSTIIVSLESGLLSLRGSSIDYVEIKTLSDLKSTLAELSVSEYKNIYIDSLSAISELFLANSKLEVPEESKTMKMYGHLLESMIGFIKYVRDIDKNIFVTALQKTTQDEIGRRFHVPDLVGSAATKCPAYFDFVFNYKIIDVEGEKQRVLVTEKTNSAVAKDRSGKLEMHEKPDLNNIITKVFV